MPHAEAANNEAIEDTGTETADPGALLNRYFASLDSQISADSKPSMAHYC